MGRSTPRAHLPALLPSPPPQPGSPPAPLARSSSPSISRHPTRTQPAMPHATSSRAILPLPTHLARARTLSRTKTKVSPSPSTKPIAKTASASLLLPPPASLVPRLYFRHSWPSLLPSSRSCERPHTHTTHTLHTHRLSCVFLV